MEGHKHYPVSGNGLERIVKFWKVLAVGLFKRSNSLIDAETNTARCRQCGRIIRLPKFTEIIEIFVDPISVILVFAAYILSYPYWRLNTVNIIIACLVVAIFIPAVGLFLEAVTMAFGKWELVEIGERSIEEVNCQLRKELEMRKKTPCFKWLSVLGVLLYVATLVGISMWADAIIMP